VFAAKVLFANCSDGSAPEMMGAEKIYRGPLAEIVAAADNTARNYNTEQKGRNTPVVVATLVAVDLSQAYCLAGQAALRQGVDTSFKEEIDQTPGEEAE
jgi:hypothetical protein